MAFFAPIMGAIAASEWFIPTIVTTAAVVIGQVAAVPGHIKPGYSTPDAHMVRVFLGMGDSRNGSDAAGVPPWIDLYDELGRHIGHDYTKKKPIPEGGFQDYVITPEQEHNNRRAAYIRLTAGHSDGVCVSGIVIVYPEGGKALIFGDIPHKKCEWPGFNSLAEIQASDDSDVEPYCFWLDNNNSYNFLPIAASFHIPDFSGQNRTLAAYTNNSALICDSAPKLSAWYPKKNSKPGKDTRIPIFDPPLKYGKDGGYDNGTINHLDPELVLNRLQKISWPASWTQSEHDKDPAAYPRFDNETWDLSKMRPSDIDGLYSRRDVEKKKAHRAEQHSRRFGDQWIMSKRRSEHHKATAVCANEWSWGPHWASADEQKFCNVADLTVWPFCTEDKEHNDAGCFDAETGRLYTPSPPTVGNSMLLGALAAAAPLATMSALNLTLRATLG